MAPDTTDPVYICKPEVHIAWSGIAIESSIQVTRYRSASFDTSLASKSAVVLCPLGTKATYVRPYGGSASSPSTRKHAERRATQERLAISGLAETFSSACHEATVDDLQDWMVCLMDGKEVVWPLSYCLVDPYVFTAILCST